MLAAPCLIASRMRGQVPQRHLGVDGQPNAQVRVSECCGSPNPSAATAKAKATAFDQFWLKRIGRPMLTWITFPCYVIFFSLLIYFIGYRLRAGESEWNELHVIALQRHWTRVEVRTRPTFDDRHLHVVDVPVLGPDPAHPGRDLASDG